MKAVPSQMYRLRLMPSDRAATQHIRQTQASRNIRISTGVLRYVHSGCCFFSASMLRRQSLHLPHTQLHCLSVRYHKAPMAGCLAECVFETALATVLRMSAAEELCKLFGATMEVRNYYTDVELALLWVLVRSFRIASELSLLYLEVRHSSQHFGTLSFEMPQCLCTSLDLGHGNTNYVELRKPFVDVGQAISINRGNAQQAQVQRSYQYLNYT